MVSWLPGGNSTNDRAPGMVSPLSSVTTTAKMARRARWRKGVASRWLMTALWGGLASECSCWIGAATPRGEAQDGPLQRQRHRQQRHSLRRDEPQLQAEAQHEHQAELQHDPLRPQLELQHPPQTIPDPAPPPSSLSSLPSTHRWSTVGDDLGTPPDLSPDVSPDLGGDGGRGDSPPAGGFRFWNFFYWVWGERRSRGGGVVGLDTGDGNSDSAVLFPVAGGDQRSVLGLETRRRQRWGRNGDGTAGVGRRPRGEGSVISFEWERGDRLFEIDTEQRKRERERGEGSVGIETGRDEPQLWMMTEPRRPGRRLQSTELRTFPNGQELTCSVIIDDGAGEGADAISFPREDEVVIRGSVVNVTWEVDAFDEETISTANVTLFENNTALDSYSELGIGNTGTFEWTVPDVSQGQEYKIAIWDGVTGVCVISHSFAISNPQSIAVSTFKGYLPSGISISPVDREYRDDLAETFPIYSCNGELLVAWETTGLIEEVSLRVCKVSDEEGSLADLEDTNLLEEGGGVGEGVLCLDATGGGSIFANMSAINATLAGETSTCGVYGKDFYANVSRADDRGMDVAGLSNTTVILGGVFQVPNSTFDEPFSAFSTQEMRWEGLTSGDDSATVDIVLRRRVLGVTTEEYGVIIADNPRDPEDGVYEWDPQDALLKLAPEESLIEDPDLEDIQFILEVYDAVSGGLVCRSDEFSLIADEISTGSSDTSALLLLLTPAALLLLCCSVVFCVACPYYEKVVRRRRREMRSSVIDVDDTYVIDGEGQPAILALDAQVIPLAHAAYWPNEQPNQQDSVRIRRVVSGTWARAMLAMGQSVTESIGRAAELAVGGVGGTSVAGHSAGSGSGNGSLAGRTLAGALDVGGASLGGNGAAGAVGVGGRDGSIEASSSISSWGVMRSGATWAFGGAGSVGGRGGGRRVGGGVYPTAAAALGIALDFEEKSEAVASGSGASSTASTTSGAGGVVRGSTSRSGRTGDEAASTTANVGGAQTELELSQTMPHNDDSVPNLTACRSWYSRQSSTGDLQGVAHDREAGFAGAAAGTAPSGSGGSARSAGSTRMGPSRPAWLGGGGLNRGAAGGAPGGVMNEEVVTVVVAGVEAHPVEIVEVAHAVTVDDQGVPISSEDMPRREIMEEFSDHGSYGEDQGERGDVAAA